MEGKLNQWSGLLRWSLQYQDGTGASDVAPMAVERREWLQKALESNIVDPMQQLKALIAVLQTPRAEPGGGRDDEDEFVQRKVEALLNCMGFVEQIDWARDFVKLQGFKAVVEMSQDPAHDIRCAALEVAGAVMQNNPPCQEAAMGLDVLPMLMRKLRGADANASAGAGAELSKTERAKALMALSCCIRNFTPATVLFVRDKGVAMLLDIARAAESAVGVRAQRKALFMLRYVLSEVPAVRIGNAAELASALSNSMLSHDVDLRESSLHLLTTVFRDAHAARRVPAQVFSETLARLDKFADGAGHFAEPADEQTQALVAELRQAVQLGAAAPPPSGDAALDDEAQETLRLSDTPANA